MFETDRNGFLTENGLMTVLLTDPKFGDFWYTHTSYPDIQLTSEQINDGRQSYIGIFADYHNVIQDFRAASVNGVSLYPVERRGSTIYINVKNASRMIFIDAMYEYQKPTRDAVTTSIYISGLYEMMCYHEYIRNNNGRMDFPLGTITQESESEFQSSIDSEFNFIGKRTSRNDWTVNEYNLVTGKHSSVKRVVQKAFDYVRNR